MECKKCQYPIAHTDVYCSQCGARVIHSRLSFSSLWSDFKDRYLDYDNTLFTTFTQLFTKPEQVLNGYLSGVRKRYMNPLSYLGIALTLSGISLIVMREVTAKIDWDVFEQGVNPELTAKLTGALYDFSSFIFVLFIPVFALAGWLSMNKKNYLISEFMVIFIYVLAHWSIALFLPVIVILLTEPAYYMQLSIPMMFLMLGYAVYCLQRVHRFPATQLALRAGVFCLLSVIGYMGIVVFFYLLLFATGTLSMQDFVPQQ